MQNGRKNNTLILRYVKNIEGDGFSDHSSLDVVGEIIYKVGEYFLKGLLSLIVIGNITAKSSCRKLNNFNKIIGSIESVHNFPSKFIF